MYKLYFKQAVWMLKQNKFISAIAIMGTALAIMMIMSIIVADEIKNISVAPEINRDRMLYIKYQVERDTTIGSWIAGAVSYQIYHDYLESMKTPELVSAVSAIRYIETPSTLVSREGSNELINTNLRMTDPNYWKMFSFSFIEGKPFNQEEYDSGLPVVVVTETLARKIFNGEVALGQTILIDFKPYRILGIVKDVSPVFKNAYGDLWIPFTSMRKNNPSCTVLLLAKNKYDFPAIFEEVRNCERKYASERTNKIIYLQGPLANKLNTKSIRGSNVKETEASISILHRKMFFILLILLLIPAINLSGLSLSRIKKRTEEIGIRKAFGANKYTILVQVLFENLITSLIGGVVGLLLSYLVVFRMRDWLLDVPTGSEIPAGTLISFPVLLAVFAVCILINLLSAGIPAYRASRMNIIHSLNQNDK